MREIEYLTEDCTKMQQIIDIVLSLRYEKAHLFSSKTILITKNASKLF